MPRMGSVSEKRNTVELHHGRHHLEAVDDERNPHPPEVRERLGVKPGDTLRYVITDSGVLLLPGRAETDDPFVAFTEWASPEDEEAFKDL